MQLEIPFDKLLEAMTRFDSDLRIKYWKNWEHHTGDKSAIEYNGRLYPIRQIVSMTTKDFEYTAFNSLLDCVKQNGLRVVNIEKRKRSHPGIREDLFGVFTSEQEFVDELN